MAATNRIELHEASITDTAQSVAASLAEAAKPGPVPTATGASPIDGAAASVAEAIATHIAASAADIAPRSAEGLAKSQAALSEMKAQDNVNASQIRAAPAGLEGRQAADRAAVQPSRAGPGPSVMPGTGIPDKLN
jgi:hypothetical protein